MLFKRGTTYLSLRAFFSEHSAGKKTSICVRFCINMLFQMHLFFSLCGKYAKENRKTENVFAEESKTCSAKPVSGYPYGVKKRL